MKKLNLFKFLRFENDKSYNVLPKLLNEGIKIDFAFIDGMHLFDYVLVDFFYVDLLLNKGGYVLFHDNWMPSVKLVINWIKNNREDYKLIQEKGSLSLFKKKYEGDDRKWYHFENFS